ncbi:MAG: hypothetical protein WHS87_10480 [Anaerolineales bacterium]
MNHLINKIGLVALLIVVVMFVLLVYVQGPIPLIRTEAEAERKRLLAEYQKALEFELEHGETIISAEDGKTRILTGKSKERMALLWQQTVQKIEALIARPADEREHVEKMIERIDGNKPIYLERFILPYNPSAALELYRAGNFFYSVDIATSSIVDISPVDINVFPKHRPNDDALKRKYSQDELQMRARDYIMKVAGEIDLDALRLVVANKEGRIYFFRWEDTTRTLRNGDPPFIQVAISSLDGEVRHYVNTLPLAVSRFRVVP